MNLVRAYLTLDMPQFDPGSFDAVFSVSVIEYLPPDALASCLGAAANLLKFGGISLHCFDFVLQGISSDYDMGNAAIS